jgi:hypothetical protein
LLTIATSLLIATLLVIPEIVQSAILKRYFTPKTTDRSKTDQLARSLFSVLIPLFVTAYFFHRFGFLHHVALHQYYEATGVSPRSDLKTLFSCLASDDLFKQAGDGFYVVLNRIWHSFLPMLWVFYALNIAVALGIGFSTQNYGVIRGWSERHWYARWLRIILNWFLLERVNFWQAILTPFVLSDKSATIMLDVLVSNGVLYQGVSDQLFFDSDGKLAGIILKNPRRFERDELKAAKASGAVVNKEDYWRTIPSEILFIVASTILNININYVTKKPVQQLRLQIENFLAQALKQQQIKISITAPSPENPPSPAS